MRKILAFVLVLTMMLTSFSAAAYAAVDSEDVSYPRIYVHGFMAREILEDKNDKNSDILWPPAADDILAAVKKGLPSLAEFAVTRDWKKLGDKVTPLVKEIFEPAFLDENGDAKGNSGVYFVYPAAETITEDSYLNFLYDWRLDPVEIAAQLNDFIEYVLDCSGCDKVDIQCHSFGGVVTSTYASIYGAEKLHTVVFNATAIFGETYTGELMTGQITLDKDAICAFMSYVFDNNDYEHLMNSVTKLLSDAGLLDFACKFGNTVIENLSDRILPEVIVPAFGGWLSVWSMVPDEDIAESVDYVFNEIYKDSATERSGLVAKINNYNTQVRPRKAEVLNDINDNANVYVISKYGYCSIPVTPSWKGMTDGVVDTKNNSFGATCSDYDSKLSEEYLAGKDPSMISPNKKVDASTCMFPEQTWFIRNAGHNLDIDEMADLFFDFDGQGTVNDFEGYPRFLLYDGAEDEIIPDDGSEEELNFAARIKLLISELRELLRTILSLMFGRIIPVC